jgi:hypothetical protein
MAASQADLDTALTAVGTAATNLGATLGTLQTQIAAEIPKIQTLIAAGTALDFTTEVTALGSIASTLTQASASLTTIAGQLKTALGV